MEHGQELVLLVYNALASGPRSQWEKTLLIVTYDEHGGFYDHVAPPLYPPDDDPKTFSRYGIRVPALIVSPLIAPRKVSRTLYDHTSIIKTILTRFCPAQLEKRSGADALIHWFEPGHPHYMGKRVAAARDLGELLELSEPRQPPDRSALIEWAAKRHAEHMTRLLTNPAEMLQPAEQHEATDLQTGILEVEQHLGDRGHPVGQP